MGYIKSQSKNAGFITGDTINIYLNSSESTAVKTAAENLRTDLIKVTGSAVSIIDNVDNADIIIGTNSVCKYSDILKRKEEYSVSVKDGKCYLSGFDRRGTVYAIYDFAENAGVSPWYFFADVPIKKKKQLCIENGFYKSEYPSVEYRGIFINDEEELEKWAKLHTKDNTIGIETYEKIFELLLRLKANYIWPAMHVNSFNATAENGILADKTGIVVGTSHCDMLMRSNNKEWKPWIEKKGYHDAKYDFSIEGRNREILWEYWRESIEQNKNLEVCYTVGMRGVHDSGFELSGFKKMSDEELLKSKINMLETIINGQRDLLENITGRNAADIPQTFVPYKEVLPLYDNGLQVPEDITIIWTNDNYGYVRRYPSLDEQKRRGGHGIYYHNSYWAIPGMDYLFISSIPLAHTKNELKKCYENGIRKIWVNNTGAMKPLEQEIEFFIRYGWEVGKDGGLTENLDRYVETMYNRDFSGNHGKEVAQLYKKYAQITNVRKVEHLRDNAFSRTAYGDEGARRLAELKKLYDKGNEIYSSLPENERDAFFQIFLMKIHASYYCNAMFYYADRSRDAFDMGAFAAADKNSKIWRKFDDAKRYMIEYYNKIMADGKWDGILTPEAYPPPVTAMFPTDKPAYKKSDAKLIIQTWNNSDVLEFTPYTQTEKWITLASSGEKYDFEIFADKWIKLSETKGTVDGEKRIFITCDKIFADGRITVHTSIGTMYIPVKSSCTVFDAIGSVEGDGVVSIDASKYDRGSGWKTIDGIGRYSGACVEADNGCLEYDFYVKSDGCFKTEFFRFPTLNSVGRIRFAVSVDNSDEIILETDCVDEHKGNWRENVMDSVDRMECTLPYISQGNHTLKIRSVDRYVTLSKIVIYTDAYKRCDLGPEYSVNTRYIPEKKCIRENIEVDFDCIDNIINSVYRSPSIELRPTVYGSKVYTTDTLLISDTIIPLNKGGTPRKSDWFESLTEKIYCEENGSIKIETEDVLAENKTAYTLPSSDGIVWHHCGSETNSQTGLAMYIPNPKLNWKNPYDAPTLNYKIRTTAGKHYIWILAKFDDTFSDTVQIGFDSIPQPINDQYLKGRMWSYQAKQIWRWIPVSEIELTAGEHLFTIYSVKSRLKLDRIYITAGNELPPDDEHWN